MGIYFISANRYFFTIKHLNISMALSYSCTSSVFTNITCYLALGQCKTVLSSFTQHYEAFTEFVLSYMLLAANFQAHFKDKHTYTHTHSCSPETRQNTRGRFHCWSPWQPVIWGHRWTFSLAFVLAGFVSSGGSLEAVHKRQAHLKAHLHQQPKPTDNTE